MSISPSFIHVTFPEDKERAERLIPIHAVTKITQSFNANNKLIPNTYDISTLYDTNGNSTRVKISEQQMEKMHTIDLIG